MQSIHSLVCCGGGSTGGPLRRDTKCASGIRCTSVLGPLTPSCIRESVRYAHRASRNHYVLPLVIHFKQPV